MAWTYAALKAADVAAGANPNLTAAMAAINAQTHVVAVDVSTSSLYGLMLLDGAWIGMQAWLAANQTDTATMPYVKIIQALLSSPSVQNIDMSDPVKSAAITGMLQAMVNGGAITPTQQSGMLALASKTVPVWQPAVTEGDIQTARTQ